MEGSRKKIITKEKALERLTSLCGRSEQCEWEIQRKLLNWRIPKEERDEIIDYLKENRYVNDQRYAASFANDKARFSAWGPQKIRIELFKRKIKPEYISAALQRVGQVVWKDGLIKNAKSKAKNLDLTGEHGRENTAKLQRYLMARGFPSGVVAKVVGRIKRQQEEKD